MMTQVYACIRFVSLMCSGSSLPQADVVGLLQSNVKRANARVPFAWNITAIDPHRH